MLLNHELAQKLVDNIMKNLGYNINIMNESGVIIASGNKERIGTFHKIAEEVINKKLRIDIYENDENKYEGVKQGINMPFYYNNEVAGVIGITGAPKEIENAAEIVRMSTELMLEQQALKERVYFHQSQKTFFINKLLTMNTDEEWSSTVHWGSKLGYDLNTPRVVCLIQIQNLDSIVKKNPLLNKEKVKEYVLNNIKGTKKHNKQDISSYVTINKIIIFKTLNKTDSENVKKELRDYIDNIKSSFGNIEVELLFGVGTYHPSMYGYNKSYEEAKAMINYGNLMNKRNETMFARDHVFELLFASINKEKMDYFLGPFVKKVNNNDEMLLTMQALIKNNMNLIKASQDLFVHRNTIVFRLNKLKEMFNINPLHNESDRLLLHLIYLYAKYYQTKDMDNV
ncbi:CdaR family transcriptional regulator [Vallitalea guaymasensis]|uniref:CdaR family transcriptional regulator n=1 Tax=Vallitalea guaymasensis TaxID=1185412 RepID=UPI000DE50AD9|nr:sugar diacid recognition domain-containing protein [Vallitalea guaymasensis]